MPNSQERDNVSLMSSSSTAPSEQTPLIGSKITDDPPPTWRAEFEWLIFNSLPIIGTYLLQNSFQMASVFTLGHRSPTELGAAALGSMFANVSAWSVAFGTTTALDTLCSQAWTGAHDKTLLGTHLQRALLILSIMFIPIGVIWWNATHILLSLNQDPELALYAGLFLRYLLIGAPAYITFEATKKFLQAQGIMKASTYVLMIASPINLGLNYMMVYPLGLGFIGAPLATSMSYWLMLGLLLLYVRFVKGSKAWGGWSRECLLGWWPFLRLAIPGIMMVCTEWWSFELCALAASYLGTIDLAAQSILLTTVSVTYTIPFGMAIAASNRVGNALGEANAEKARYATMAVMVYAVVFGCLNSLILMLTRSWFGYLFTSEKEVVERVASIIPLCALFQIADGLASVCGGAIRGLGRQNIAAWINIFAYYIVALPIGLFLTFKAGWNLSGLWAGLSIALFIASMGEGLFLLSIHWQAEVRKTQQRVKQEDGLGAMTTAEA
ncbi:mate-domain-containing protein [Spinellus fusiger]|nr:mate-domain-containing protein [Spinellus fusiger]